MEKRTNSAAKLDINGLNHMKRQGTVVPIRSGLAIPLLINCKFGIFTTCRFVIPIIRGTTTKWSTNHAIAAPLMPQRGISKKQNGTLMTTSRIWIFAGISGLPAPCAAVTQVQAEELIKFAKANILRGKALLAAKSDPIHNPSISLANIISNAVIGTTAAIIYFVLRK